MAQNQLILYGTAIISLFVLSFIRFQLRGLKLSHIPTHGHAGYFTRVISYYRFAFDNKAFIQEGLDKHGTAMFKIVTMSGWRVICADSSFVEDIRKAHESDISMHAAVDVTIQGKYTTGVLYEDDGSRAIYHIGVVRNQLTKNLAVQFPEVYDEMSRAFADNIGLEEDWVSLPAMKTIMNIVSRTSNRYFVGLPLCRNPEWINLNITFTIDVMKTAHFLNLFPNFIKPFIARLVPTCRNAIKRGEKWVFPLLKDRLEQEARLGKDWVAPNDLISWLLESASETMRRPENINHALLTLNFAAIHTSTMTFTHALYHLVSKQEYIEPLREEVRSVINEEGWTKAAMGRMRKLDSFFRESVRMENLSSFSMNRVLQTDYTFSNGVTLPAGTFTSVLSAHRHRQESIYPHAQQFEGFRFSQLREDEDGAAIKHQLSSTGTDWVAFGHGRHSCPGRFFAANEIKAMMAHLLLSYDMKLADEGVRPKNLTVGGNNIPNPRAEILFRKRRTM